MKSKYILLILLLIIYFNHHGQAGVGDWTTFTSQNDIRDLILVDDYIWCATNGGVFSYQISTGIYQQFNNTNGLKSVNAQTLEIDHRGNIWVGFADGWINYYNPLSNSWKNVQDYLGHRIYDLEAVGDSLLVALNLGISLYDIQRREVKETYKHLGWQLSSEIDVFDIMINNRELWAATASGIARSSFDLANLMAPESWTDYTTTHGLPANQINSLVAHNDSIYTSTTLGVAVLRIDGWATMNHGLDNIDIKRLTSKNAKLYAISTEYVSRWDTTENRWRNIAPWFPTMNCLAITGNDELWVGRTKSGYGAGLAHFSLVDQKWQLFNPPGPPSNEFNGLAVDKNGILWCASPHDGIFKYDGVIWRQFTTADGLINNGIKSVIIDSRNRKWFASTGGGLIMVDIDESISVFYNEILSGSTGSPDFVVVSDINADQYDNIWALNSFAANNNVVAVYTPQLDWHFFAVQEGILSDVLTSLDFDQVDRVWIGTQSGVSVIDYNNTLADKSDDLIEGNNLTTVDGLINNSIKDIAIDQDDIVWIATEGGLNYWTRGEVGTQYGLLSNSVNTIEVDIRNNKWFGTTAGVSILASDGYSWTHYSTDNSPLVSDNVTSFGFDLETGKVYIGTTNGLSMLETPFSRPREDLSQVKAGPNPFIVGNGQDFAISELSDDVDIKVMTEHGMIVRHISKDDILGAYTTWDGKNDNGEYVASGIYIYVIYNEDTGLNRVGKVAVIR
ncbi:MAG: hypothetical protein JSW07_12850 [bacterium]|nr:MAG: hypothetical protein JSW07_12850 [bacterium]